MHDVAEETSEETDSDPTESQRNFDSAEEQSFSSDEEIEQVTNLLSSQLIESQNENTIVAGTRHITLTTAAASRIYDTTGWLCDDGIRVYLYGVLGERALVKGIKNIAFVAPPQGVVRIKRPRGQGALAQDVIKSVPHLVVTVENIGGGHWVSMYAYSMPRSNIVLVFDSLRRSYTRKEHPEIKTTAYKLIQALADLETSFDNPWVAGTRTVLFADEWPRQLDECNCGPMSLLAASLAIDIDLGKLEMSAESVTNQPPFQNFALQKNPGAFAREEIQKNIKKWQHANPAVPPRK